MRPIRATIDLAALTHNLRVVRDTAPRSKIFAVIKANAYGHGLLRAARSFIDTDGFAVVELEAAVRLREAGYAHRIALLEGYFEPRELAVLAQHKLTTTIHDFEQIAMLDAAPEGAALDVLVKINTGMNRLGFQPAEFPQALARLHEHRAIGKLTLMTHFATADDSTGIATQLELFERLTRDAQLPRTLANSAAVLRFPESHGDWVRPGIMLYGCSPFAEGVAADLGLKPAMTVTSEIIATRDIAIGESVGYGATFTAGKSMRIGVVACGYADGYPRHAPTGTPVRVGDRLTSTVGRVSMDMITIDLTRIDANVGTPVVIWGEGNPVENVARAAGTVGYELLCALAPRVPVVEKA